MSVRLYLHPGSPLRMSGVDVIKRHFSLLRSAGNLERQKCVFSRSSIKLGSWSGVEAECCPPRGAAAARLPGAGIHGHVANLQATEHLPAVSSNLK